MTATMWHLTHDQDFRIDAERTVIGGWPCRAMQGVLYVSTVPARWAATRGYGAWDERQYAAEIVINPDAVEGVDIETRADETLILNVAVANLVRVVPLANALGIVS